MEYYALFWLILMVVFVVIEIMTMGLYTIWFAGGALVAFFVAMLGFNAWIQLWALVIVTIILLFFTRPIVQKKFSGNRLKTELDTLVGKSIVISERVDNKARTGKANLNGVDWTVRAKDDARIIEVDSTVTVVSVEGVKLIVE